MAKRVGFVATGDEIINGDIVNSNTAYFAQQLKLNDIQPGKQITVTDDETEIRDAILYLAKDHDCIITIGGLGPTKDDLTRDALAAAINHPLEFYQEPWQWIVDKFNQLKITMTDNNKQQAYLPKSSTAIYNPNGTACACYVKAEGKHYFMLPGPPNECFPIFDEHVIPELLKKGFAKKVYRKTWLLFGTSESRIADQLEQIERNGCELGYRVSYPYLEIKLKAQNEIDLNNVTPRFDEALNDLTVSHDRERASEKLYKLIAQRKKAFSINDKATGGRLESLLLSPETADNLSFDNSPFFSNGVDLPSKSGGFDRTHVNLTGLTNYWNNIKSDFFELELTINDKTEKLKVPSRKEKTLVYACELICLKLL